MDNANYAPALPPFLLAALGSERSTLIDVGCSGGIDSLWRLFGSHLEAHGFDPQRREMARLSAVEMNPNVRYHASRVGLPADHPFVVERDAHRIRKPAYFRPRWKRLSSTAAVRQHGLARQSQSVGEDRTTGILSIDAFAAREGLPSIDFVKIDTDGFDLEAALSCEKSIRGKDILGFLIETPFMGGAAPTANTFRNIDRFMKSQGLALFALTTHHYSRPQLPACFVYRIPAQTEVGQIIWGDALYLRDAASPGYRRNFDIDLSVPKLLKLIALFELFQLPDCAAELLLSRRATLAEAIDVDLALDLLTRSLVGEPRSHAEHRPSSRPTSRPSFHLPRSRKRRTRRGPICGSAWDGCWRRLRGASVPESAGGRAG